jgi:hypothetical protein
MQKENQQKTLDWKKLKVRCKKKLLDNYINDINSEIDDNISSLKNKMLIKSLISELTDEKIIMNNNKIIEIKGIKKNDEGLLFLYDKELFNKKKKNI